MNWKKREAGQYITRGAKTKIGVFGWIGIIWWGFWFLLLLFVTLDGIGENNSQVLGGLVMTIPPVVILYRIIMSRIYGKQALWLEKRLYGLKNKSLSYEEFCGICGSSKAVLILEKLILKGLITGIHIDYANEKIGLKGNKAYSKRESASKETETADEPDVKEKTVKCPSCGASNMIRYKEPGRCEYCDSPLEWRT